GIQTFNTNGNTQQLLIAQNRLYSHDFTGNLLIWDNASSFTTARGPDHALDAGSGLSGIRDLTALGDTLVVTQTGGAVGKVNLFTNASAINANTAPTQSITNAAVGSGAARAVLGSDGTLYVIDADSVSIFGSALTAPAFKVDLATGGLPNDVLLLE